MCSLRQARGEVALFDNMAIDPLDGKKPCPRDKSGALPEVGIAGGRSPKMRDPATEANVKGAFP